MKRRSFLRKLGIGAAAPLLLNNIPVNALANSNALARLAASVPEDNDRVLVLIQLHGGNDGLNMIIPANQYQEYNRIRPNIAISDSGANKYIDLDSGLADKTGLHPEMTGIKSLYENNQAAIIQGVAYENMNQSHFRSRDIWFMGGDSDQYSSSGWMGRYLDHLYPGYPQDYPSATMPDPLGLEIGNSVSLAFHRAEGIPTAISVQNPDQFYNLINNVGGLPPESVEDTYYGKELQWIMDIEEKSNEYAGRLREVYEAGEKKASAIVYPETYPKAVQTGRFSKNSLGAQLKVVSRLIAGGSKTKIYMVRLGGFDTHANQVRDDATHLGPHAVLMYYLSASIKAFMDDLKAQNLDDRVMGATFSEFGRRAASNGSYGTDHGTASPMIVFGKSVQAGVYGANPDLSDLYRGNIKQQHDYRQVFTALLKDWMRASDEAIEKSQFQDYVADRVPFVEGALGLNDTIKSSRATLASPYPNPVVNHVTYSYSLNRAMEVHISLYASNGMKIKDIKKSDYQLPGNYQLVDDLSNLPKGVYILKLSGSGGFERAKQVIKM